jgi:pentatricopeptide repeat protein
VLLLCMLCRSGQHEVAMDAYRNMLAQGLAPAATTFKAVVTALLQRGSLEEADGVLASLAQQLRSSGGGGGGDAPGTEVCPAAVMAGMHGA